MKTWRVFDDGEEMHKKLMDAAIWAWMVADSLMGGWE